MSRIEQFIRNRSKMERALLMFAAAGMIFLAGMRAGEFAAYVSAAA